MAVSDRDDKVILSLTLNRLYNSTRILLTISNPKIIVSASGKATATAQSHAHTITNYYTCVHL